MPASIHGAFAGAAQAYAQSTGTIPLLIVFIVAQRFLIRGQTVGAVKG